MNFEQAILAHKKWKDRLRESITSGQPLNVDDAISDCKCDLGKWIHGDGRKYGTLTEFKTVREAHARFHQCAGTVIRKSAGRPPAEALKLLEIGSEFAQSTTSCIQALKSLSLNPAFRG